MREHTIATMIGLMMIALTPVQAVVSEMPPPDELVVPPVELVDVAGLNGDVQAPDYVYAGNRFHVVVNVWIEAAGMEIIHIEPIIPDASLSPCGLVSFSITGGLEAGTNTYALVSGVPLPDLGGGDPQEGLDALAIDLVFDTGENTLGECRMGATVAKALEVLDEAFMTLTAIVDVVELPAIPVVLGEMKTVGGPMVDDEAVVVVPPPVEEIPVTVTTSTVKVAGEGLVWHDDVSFHDEGLFRITLNDAEKNRQVLADSDSLKTRLQGEGFLAHSPGEYVDNPLCLKGVYVDKGAWTDYEGSKESCVNLRTYEPLAGGLDGLCSAFFSPAAQNQLDSFPYAWVPNSPAALPALTSLRPDLPLMGDEIETLEGFPLPASAQAEPEGITVFDQNFGLENACDTIDSQ